MAQWIRSLVGGESRQSAQGGDSAVTPSASFTTERLSPSTFLIVEDDAFDESPFIYAKLHPKAPILVLTDTGCDEASSGKKYADFTRLRDYLENYPVPSNNNKPLNPPGAHQRQYYIICTHCHYDHIGGISQFLEGGTTEIIASAAGKEFIESDLESHGLFKYVDKVMPYYNVTHYVQAFERLHYPIVHHNDDLQNRKPIDLGMTFIHTPGHTPDSLAWYDVDEMHLYVGDTLYEEGPTEMRIQFPGEGNLIEWFFSMQKLQSFVRAQNAASKRLFELQQTDYEADWYVLGKRVKLGAGHQTHSADAELLIELVLRFWRRMLEGDVPVIKKEYRREDAYYTWRELDGASGLSFQAPARLMDEARKFFGDGTTSDE